jgi:hypothetical protein
MCASRYWTELIDLSEGLPTELARTLEIDHFSKKHEENMQGSAVVCVGKPEKNRIKMRSRKSGKNVIYQKQEK